MAHFEFVSKYADCGLALPVRKTELAAGYDFEVAEDIIIPPYDYLMEELINTRAIQEKCTQGDALETPITLGDLAKLTKLADAKPTLVPTGVKAYLEPDTFLQLSVRSSCPLKNWLVLANGVGIIDADYVNATNEGHIYFQIINLSPFPIMLKKGDIIGQGVIIPYSKIENDEAQAQRTGGFGSTGG